jgi:hypothetical protein
MRQEYPKRWRTHCQRPQFLSFLYSKKPGIFRTVMMWIFHEVKGYPINKPVPCLISGQNVTGTGEEAASISNMTGFHSQPFELFVQFHGLSLRTDVLSTAVKTGYPRKYYKKAECQQYDDNK